MRCAVCGADIPVGASECELCGTRASTGDQEFIYTDRHIREREQRLSGGEGAAQRRNLQRASLTSFPAPPITGETGDVDSASTPDPEPAVESSTIQRLKLLRKQRSRLLVGGVIVVIVLVTILPGVVVGPLLINSSPMGSPSWSPDGRRIAHQCGDWICLSPTIGGGSIRLVRGARPAWSPDGQRILFECATQSEDICVVEIASGEVMNVTSGRGSRFQFGNPRWSPDGQMLTAEVVDPSDGVTEICTMSVDGQDGERIVSEGSDAAMPSWSPDGRSIAFISQHQLVAVGADAGSVQPLQFAPALPSVGDPAWSPDGSRIAFDSGGNIWILDVASQSARKLTEGMNSLSSAPTWSPDGARIAFERETRCGLWLWGWLQRRSIFIISEDGSGITKFR